MTGGPIRFIWMGDGFTPAAAYYQKLADEHYVIGEKYTLVEHHSRSANTHNHFFAQVADSWGNLPDHLLPEYQSPEMLRKKALIRKGFCDERSIVCASKAEALRVAAFIKPMDDYAIVIASEAVVKVLTAKSQSHKAMGAKAFAESKQAVFDFIDDLLTVKRGSTEQNAGQAA